MHTPDPHDHKPEEIDASSGFEKSDIRVTGIVVFLTALAILVAVVGVLTYGIGKVINAHLIKEDGPDGKWTKTADVRELGDMPNNPAIQKKMSEIINTFPAPRLQVDDGEQDVAELHQREDLLLDHYTWVNQGKGTVRIPIKRAMELIAQRGLPVVQAATPEPLMTGDHHPVITMPLTDGFARTGYEQALAASEGESTSGK